MRALPPPRPSPPADRPPDARELAADVRWRNRSLIRELRVEVIEGGVLLHGHAYSYYGKQVAQHEVLRRTGLALLANRITVADRAGTTAD